MSRMKSRPASAVTVSVVIPGSCLGPSAKFGPASQIVPERGSRRPDAVEIALEHGRHRKPPMRKAKDDPVRPPQLLCEARYRLLGIGSLIIAAPLRLGHGRRKTLAVEIGRNHLV